MQDPSLPIHSHAHPVSGRGGDRKRLAIALMITALFTVVELVGGAFTNSLALVADAGHMASDVAALALALFATWFADRPPSARRSYGYHRVEILAALTNGVLLWLIAAAIFYEASQRFQTVPEVRSGPMLAVAMVGLLANIASARVLTGGSARSLNLRGALVHVLGDTLGSVGAILAALLMLSFGWFVADPIISVLIGLLILASSARLVWPAAHILLEGTPMEMTLAELERSITQTDGVLAVHDLHAWALTSGYNAMTAHVVVADDIPPSDRELVLDRLRHMIPDRFPIRHLTIQLEESSHCCDEAHLPGAAPPEGIGRDAHGMERPGERS